MAKRKTILGVIAEDDSDVACLQIIASRIKGRRIPVKKHVGEGCGRIHRKCLAWAKNLHNRGCNTLVVLHDLDRRKLDELQSALRLALLDNPIGLHFICIPVEEMEAWLLSDEQAIKKVMGLQKLPGQVSNPEKIKSPKEHLERMVRKTSGGKRMYIHTTHNAKLVTEIKIDLIKHKCPSFLGLSDFIAREMH